MVTNRQKNIKVKQIKQIQIQKNMQSQNRNLCKKTEEKRYTNFRWIGVIQIKRKTNRQTDKKDREKERNSKERQK